MYNIRGLYLDVCIYKAVLLKLGILWERRGGRFSLFAEKKREDGFARHRCIFTARPEAQRCQVTPYVVNVVVVVVVGGGSDS